MGLKSKIKIISGVLTAVVLAGGLWINNEIPTQIKLYEGEAYSYKIAPPFYENQSDINIEKTQKQGTYNMSLKLFGLIQVKTVEVNIMPQVSLIPGGQTVGMRMKSDGVMVVNREPVLTSNGEVDIAEISGIKVGDRITKVNGQKCESTSMLAKVIEKEQGKELDFEIIRGDKTINVKATPRYDTRYNVYRLGIWLRDGTIGIGTVTFVDPKTGIFGALGHGIADVDTGQVITISDGIVSGTNIFDIKKGKKGEAGELKGTVLGTESKLGRIGCNTNLGVFGTLNKFKPEDPLPVASRTQVKQGAATIKSCIDKRGVQSFDIEIVKIDPKNLFGLKGMEIKVTDPGLIEATGGIVQGMSGSPIIQDGKIVGAVTHVFINDPTRGYAVYLEDMLTELKRWNIN